ncbi:MAG TPA: hypothetical protein PKE39_11335 [Ignavibacteria bacterium]|nr:hypothetical protein [Ignavibacteria bacterium]HMQ99606.1 hypothetical protein [Ignavibacteria bacterium]
MKKTLLLFIPVFLLAVLIAACGNNTGTGLLGQGNNNVTFTMGVQQSTNGVQFTWQPNVSVRVSQMILGTNGFSDTITDNSNQLYTGNEVWAYPNEYTGVTSGQQWQFSFTGTDSLNQGYTATANLTIP